ncbi:YolD-like family protein [Siminovitchia fortis]|uniref:YolD-like family protein n=1 Tax=Siminovitchia fortis TaxID=254758 RepID=UPI0011A3E4FC|nr:YolD-like family protein [Siminovitchia fortis]
MKPNKLTPGSNMRWESSRMMLPEHVQALKDANVDSKRVKRPQLDEQEWEQVNETIHIAIEYNLPVVFTLWIDGFFDEIRGMVHYVNQMNKLVHVVDTSLESHRIDFDSIVSVKFAE